ncbi:MAG: sulfatase-like hydrolase/transferase [Maribacter stanieri]
MVLCFLMITSCKNTKSVQKPNILLLCIDDLRPELNCFGANYISSPNIDQLAKNEVAFQSHFDNAPSCGPSRYTLLTGQFGSADNNALFLRASKIAQGSEAIDPSMPEWFKTH